MEVQAESVPLTLSRSLLSRPSHSRKLRTSVSSPTEAEFNVPPRLLTFDDLAKQLDNWQQLTPRKRSTKKKPPEQEM